MKVTLRKIADKEKEQVIIECTQVTSEIEDIYSYVSTKGTELCGMAGEKMCRFIRNGFK